MTNLNDLDRALAEFLEDGPNTAPEAPVIAAMAHARTTPRRPDPLRRFRPDVMTPRRRGLGARPGLVFAGLALVVALAGVAVVGSRGPQNAILPAPSATAQPGATATPTTVPSQALVPFSKQVTLLVSAGKPYAIAVADTTGEVMDARSLQPGDGASVDENTLQIDLDPADETALILTWMGTPCERTGSLLIEEPIRQITISRERCEGDLLPVDRVMRLQFATRANRNAWSFRFDDVAPDASLTVPAASSAP